MKEKRIFAFLIDYIFSVTIAGVIASILTLLEFLELDPDFILDVFTIFIPVIMFAYFYLIFRDIFKGKSVGKRIMKLKIVSLNNTNANLIKIMLHDITVLVWPIDALLLLFNKKTLGELISKTQVINK